MPNSSCVMFQESWLKEPCFETWLRRGTGSDCKDAFCVICKKTFDFKSMGRSALVSHMKGKKHVALANAKNLSDRGSLMKFVSKSSDIQTDSDRPTTSKPCGPSTSFMPGSKASMDKFLSDSSTLHSEIWWCIRTAVNNHSASSNKDIDLYLKRMFPNVPSVQKFSCGETKSSYLMSFGIAPHFKSILILVDQLSDQPFGLLFDESLNKSLIQKQLDIHLRFWICGKVESRYFDSRMLGHSTSQDLLETLNTCKESVNFKNLIHLSMDGPNVNWATFDKLQRQLHTDYNNTLFNIGSCGLHQLHNALRKGIDVTGWDLSHILSSAYYLFKDVPARRDDFIQLTGCVNFPSKFCGHRWVENKNVIIRLKEMLGALRIYVKAVKDKKVPDPATKSFSVIKSFIEDPFCEIKLAFAISMCKPVERFLVIYQTDKPMIPFLYQDLIGLIASLAKRVVKPDKLGDVRDLDISKKDDLLEYTKVNIGTEASEMLKKSKCSPKEILSFRMACRDALVTVVSKLLMKKSPVSFSLCRYLQFLNPSVILNSSSAATKHLKSALIATDHCPLDEVDDILEEFDEFQKSVKNNNAFLNFNCCNDRVDVLFSNIIGSNHQYAKLWKFVRKCLVISHGQATVERGFSENKMALETNMGERTLIARRTIKDYIRHLGGVDKFVICDELAKSCTLAHRRYQAYLEENKTMVNKSSKRKRMEEEIQVLKRRKVDMEENASYLRKEGEMQADKADSVTAMKEQLALFTSANALRKSAKQKEEEIASITKDIEEKEAVLKTL